MLSLTALVSLVERMLDGKSDSALLHLITYDRPTATTLVAICYAHAGETGSIGFDFVDRAEKVAERYVAMVAQPC